MDLSNSLFSPSVAKQHQATAKDWAYIDSWLSTLFPSPSSVPQFERNPDTLRALLALATQNSTANEEATLLSASSSRSLTALTPPSHSPHTSLLQDLKASLTPEGHTALNALAHLSTTTNLAIPDTELLGRRMLDLQISSHDLSQASARLTALETHLATELALIHALLDDLQTPSYQPDPELRKATLDHQRRSKALAAKLPELRDRVASYQASAGSESSVTIPDVKAEEERFKDALAVVRGLEAQVKAYHGLPQDTDLARLELESLRVELRELSMQRDSMFEGLVERETPRKPRF